MQITLPRLMPETYVHIFLFECTACHGPLSSAYLQKESTLEAADGLAFHPYCECGWSGDVMGFDALRHWVQEWNGN